MTFQTYSQDTTQININNTYIVDSVSNITTLTPIVIKKNNTVYYGFNTNQSEYLYNSLLMRDFYYDKYNDKKNDLDTIIVYYDSLVVVLESQNNNKDSIIQLTNNKFDLKTNECIEQEEIYLEEIKKQKRKTLGTIVVSVATIILFVLIL